MRGDPFGLLDESVIHHRGNERIEPCKNPFSHVWVNSAAPFGDAVLCFARDLFGTI